MTIDIIGKIVDTPATFDDEGEQLTAATFKPGYFVNTQEPVPEWEVHRVYPEKPQRVFSNGTAIHYRLDSYDHFISERDRVFPQEFPQELDENDE